MASSPGSTQSTHTLRLLSDATSMKKGLDAVDAELKKVVVQLDRHQAAAVQSAEAARKQSATEKELAADLAKTARGFKEYTSEVERLRAKFIPMAATAQQYERDLEELNQAQKMGVLSTKQYETAMETLNAEMASQVIHGKSVAAMKEEEARATRQLAADTDMLRAKYVPLYRVSRQYETLLDEINRGEKTGALTKKQHAAATEQLNLEYQQFNAGAFTGMNRFASASRGSVKGMGQFNMAVQQGGYQLQDFVVQMQGGTSFFTAFAQQGSQFAGIFGPTGAVVGAMLALGAVAAGLGLKFLNSGEDALTAAEQVEEFASAIADYKDIAEISIATTEELAQTFGGYAETVRGALVAQRENTLASALKEEKAALEAVNPLIEKYATAADLLAKMDIAEGATEKTSLNANADLESRALLMRTVNDLTEEQLSQIVSLNEAYAQGGDVQNQLEEAEAFRAVLIEIFGTIEKVPTELWDASEAMLDTAVSATELAAAVDKTGGVAQEFGNAMELVSVRAEDLLPPLSEAEEIIERITSHLAEFGADITVLEDAYGSVTDLDHGVQSVKDELDESVKYATDLREEIGDAAYDALILSNVDMASGVDAAAIAAAQLAADLGIALSAALAMQTMLNAEDIAMSQPVVTGPATDRFDADTLLGMGYTSEYLTSIGKIKPERGGSKGGGSKGGGGKEEKDPLAELMAQLKAEQDLLGVEETRAEVLKTLGEDASKYTEEQIQGAIDLQHQIDAQTEAYSQQKEVVDILGSNLGDMFFSLVTNAESAEDAIIGMVKNMLMELSRVIIMQSIIGGFSPGGGASSGLAGMIGDTLFAKGAAFNAGDVVPFGKGGVVDGASLFPMSRGKTGVMGEAGPEAIMPLERDSSGNLGVAGPTISVHNYSGEPATVRQSQSEVEVIVGRAVEAARADFSRSMATGQGQYSRALEGGFKVKRNSS